MSRSSLIAAAAVSIALASGAMAATTVKGSKSNSDNRECPKVGGTWRDGPEGVGCYVPIPTKSEPASTAPNSAKSKSTNN